MAETSKDESDSGFLSFVVGENSYKGNDTDKFMFNNDFMKSSMDLASTLMNSSGFRSGVDAFVAAGNLFNQQTAAQFIPGLPETVDEPAKDKEPNPVEEEAKPAKKVKTKTTATEKTMQNLFGEPIFRR